MNYIVETIKQIKSEKLSKCDYKKLANIGVLGRWKLKPNVEWESEL